MLSQKKSSENLDGTAKSITFAIVLKTASRGGAVVARWAHNPKAGGSIPSPATKGERKFSLFFYSFQSFLKNKLFSLLFPTFIKYLRM